MSKVRSANNAGLKDIAFARVFLRLSLGKDFSKWPARRFLGA